MNSSDLQSTISELSALLSYADSTAQHASEILDGTVTHHGRTALVASAQIGESLRNLIWELQVDLDNVLRREANSEDENHFR